MVIGLGLLFVITQVTVCLSANEGVIEPVFETTFREHELPVAIRTDNGRVAHLSTDSSQACQVGFCIMI